MSEAHWKEPLKWNAAAAKAGRRARVFCSSMADVFEAHPTLPPLRERLWALIEATPWLDWQLLTKRPENVLCHPSGPMVPAAWLDGFPVNIWLGASAENQEWYDRRRLYLRGIPARVRFWSMEPLLGPIHLDEFDNAAWIIAGGESGHGARPMHPRWVRDIRDQCQQRGVNFFFKQWGEWHPDCLCDTPRPCKETPRPQPGGIGVMFRCGKHAGRALDGREWNEVPA